MSAKATNDVNLDGKYRVMNTIDAAAPSYKYKVQASTFAGAVPTDTSFQTGILFSFPAGEQLVSVMALQNTPFIVTGEISVQMVLLYGPGAVNLAFQVEVLQGVGLDVQPTGFKGVYRDRAAMGVGDALTSTTAPTDFVIAISLSTKTFADITQYGDLDIWINTIKLP